MEGPDAPPGRPSLLVLVRHAESARNVAKKGNAFFADDESRSSVRGVPDHDIPLTAEGGRQSRAVGAALRERHGAFDYVYHSGYLRTVETTEGLLSSLSPGERSLVRVRSSLFVRERDSGWAYDMTTAEAEAAFPWLRDYWRTAGSFYARPPGGESVAQVCERVYLFLNMLFRDRAGKKVLFVTHGLTMRAFRFLLERWSHDDPRLKGEAAPNCSVTTYVMDEGEGRLALRGSNEVFWR